MVGIKSVVRIQSVTESVCKVLQPRRLEGRAVCLEATPRGLRRVEIRDDVDDLCCTPGGSTRPPSMAAVAILEQVRSELESYFSGCTRRFRAPLDLGDLGTSFQRRVWNRLLEIPYGAVLSYGDVAHDVGSPRAVRAVGQAVARNPLPVIVPCHRVVGSDGRLTGFGCGLPVKVRLLEIEGVPLGPPTGSEAGRKVLLARQRPVRGRASCCRR